MFDTSSHSLAATAARELVRRPSLPLSIVAHAAMLALLYYYGSYQPALREQADEITSSLHATDAASTAKRLKDLETIKQLLERSADRTDASAEPDPPSGPTPQSPEEMVDRARELSEAIETLDEEIRAEELAELLGTPQKAPEPRTDAAVPDAGESAVTPETAAKEVAALEDKARATLARRQQRLEARENGISVEAGARRPDAKSGNGDPRDSSNGSSRRKVRGAIAAFLAAGRRAPQTLRTRAYGNEGVDREDAESFEVPAVDSSMLVLGRGRMLGAGGEYANRVFVNNWYIIGPFPGLHGGDRLFENPVYPPEKAVLLDAVYVGKGGRLLKWRYFTTQGYPLFPPDLVEDGVYYGYTEISVDEDCELTAWIGADDDVQVYVNEQPVWDGGNVNKMPYFTAVYSTDASHTRDYNRSEGKRTVHFNRGRNTIFFKLSNGAQGGFVSIVLTR